MKHPIYLSFPMTGVNGRPLWIDALMKVEAFQCFDPQQSTLDQLVKGYWPLKNMHYFQLARPLGLPREALYETPQFERWLGTNSDPLTDLEILIHDLWFLVRCSCIVADVSRPSASVAQELLYAKQLGIATVVVQGDQPVSAFIMAHSPVVWNGAASLEETIYKAIKERGR